MWILSGDQTKQTLRQSCSQLELRLLERSLELENLSQQLLRVQDDERRRVARDLHDSAGQTLTALKISVVQLGRRLGKDTRTCAELSAIAHLADEALQEIRTTSYLLHPPMLDEAGFTSAAQWYVAGFAQRSGMTVRMNFAPEVERLPAAIEIALFRVLQESLTNVHRHSRTSEVEVTFRLEEDAAILEVRDYGRGMGRESSNQTGASVQHCGVGLSGMRERLNELKGGLEIESANPGTRLRALVPLFTRQHQNAMPASVAGMGFPFSGAKPALPSQAA